MADFQFLRIQPSVITGFALQHRGSSALLVIDNRNGLNCQKGTDRKFRVKAKVIVTQQFIIPSCQFDFVGETMPDIGVMLDMSGPGDFAALAIVRHIGEQRVEGR